MDELASTLFGQGDDLDVLQMALRGAAVFLLTLAMIRVSGRRSVGQHRAFDACTTVLLGSRRSDHGRARRTGPVTAQPSSGMAVAAKTASTSPARMPMSTNASPPGGPGKSPAGERDGTPVQTGSLPGGQPGQGVNTSSSRDGQSNVDAVEREGTEYGTHERDRPRR